jgi:hypothetical protein
MTFGHKKREHGKELPLKLGHAPGTRHRPKPAIEDNPAPATRARSGAHTLVQRFWHSSDLVCIEQCGERLRVITFLFLRHRLVCTAVKNAPLHSFGVFQVVGHHENQHRRTFPAGARVAPLTGRNQPTPPSFNSRNRRPGVTTLCVKPAGGMASSALLREHCLYCLSHA